MLAIKPDIFFSKETRNQLYDSKIINRLLTWTDIIDICFQKEGYFVFFGSIQIKFWLVRWSNGKNFRFVDTRTCISLQLDQYQNHRSHTLKILATTQRWVTSLNSSTPQNKTGIEWVCGAYENFCEDNPPISKPPRILSLRWLVGLSLISLKLHKHRGGYWRKKLPWTILEEQFPVARNTDASEIGNGVISLLWQPRCYCNPGRNPVRSGNCSPIVANGDVVDHQTCEVLTLKNPIEPPSLKKIVSSSNGMLYLQAHGRTATRAKTTVSFASISRAYIYWNTESSKQNRL